jgi:phosphoserine aminotransferase
MQVLASVVIVTVRSSLVITRNKIPTSWLNKSNLNSKHNTLKHSYYNTMEMVVQGHYNTRV